jgi:hypothetical protein
MKIIGPDALVFAVDDVASCTQYLVGGTQEGAI